MNLVQINERLKDMPEMALKQYANGSNPSVPPYLALAEIQRRERIKQQMANAQGAAQGDQPSIKEQIEQKAGLLGLQQAQLMQQQQQMMQPRPGPVPAGVPQPADQPEAEEMAAGGIARIPVRDDLYQFAGGGIIAFQRGGQTMGPSQYENMSPGTIEDLKARRDEYIRQYGQERYERILAEAERALASQQQQFSQQLRPAAPAQPVRPGMPARSPLMDEALSAARQMPEKPTAEGTIAGINALLPPELQEEARKERAEAAKQRMAQAEERFKASRPSGLDQLIRVFGQSGQYKGLTGLGPAYTQNRDRLAAEEAAFQREQEAMRAAAEKQQLGEAAGMFEARAKDFSANTEAYRKQLGSRTEALAGLAGADQRAIDAALGRMNDMEVAKLKIAADKANALRPGAGERITAQILKLRADGKVKEADELLQTYSAVSGSGAAGVGAQRNVLAQKRAALASYKDIRDNAESDAERKEAQANIMRLTRELAKLEETGGESGFNVTVGGKTYTFPTQQQADAFKKEAGVK
jgi:hypothetical protein